MYLVISEGGRFGKKSKRVSTKQRVKVEKKVREHKRKLRREAKKNPKKTKAKDPGVPNILPFKEDVLKEAAAYKEKKEQEREKKKAARKKARESLQNKNRNLGAIMKEAEKNQRSYDKNQGTLKEEANSSSFNRPLENSRKAFYKEFKKVIDAADVVLEVLDARDPLGSRCTEVEDAVRSADGNKKLVLVLNKIDLVPRSNVQAWLTELRKELPAIAFKASTQQQRGHLTQSKVDYFAATDNLVKSSNCLGADVLMKLLGNYHHGSEMSINVGVVGFPNTGKSSIINSLKRSRTCNVGALPGITKAMQTIHLDKHIKLLDSPGVVLTSSPSQTAAVLRNVVRLETIEDPVPCVEAILSRCQKMQMKLHYNIADYADTTEFLTLLAHRMGRLKKGGVPDINRAARGMIQDWNSGRITYYTAPPEPSKQNSHHVKATIVKEWSKEFNIDELIAEENKMLEDLPEKSASLLVGSTGPMKAVVREEDLEDEVMMAGDEEDDDDDYEDIDDEEDMDDDDDEEKKELKGVTVAAGAKTKKGSTKPVAVSTPPVRHRGPPPKVPLERVGGLVTKRSRKLAEKKDKKKRKRADATAGKLSDALTTALSGFGNDDYSFEKDYS